VVAFSEKPEDDGGWVNGGFFLLSPKVGDLITNDATIWEREPMNRLAETDQLRAFIHKGFWAPMDTLRDKLFLDEAWNRGDAPWRIW
jgi:glucose-1-phosphate cytidylyltransferase